MTTTSKTRRTFLAASGALAATTAGGLLVPARATSLAPT